MLALGESIAFFPETAATRRALLECRRMSYDGARMKRNPHSATTARV